MDPAVPSMNVKSATTSFDDMPLHQSILRGIYAHGFEKPSPIQQLAILPLIRGGDMIAQAQSGTGKTGAFTIGLLQRIDRTRTNMVQALVLEPTRELAEQSRDVICSIGDYYFDGDAARACHLLTGGTKIHEDLKKLQAGVTISVGTPGRVLDVIKRGALNVQGLKLIVLDEADEMLSQGFAEQVSEIFKFVPKDVQLALYSATMPEEVLDLTQRFMRDPTKILVPADKLSLEGIAQFYVSLTEEQKLDALLDLFEAINISQAVIFCSTRHKVTWLGEQLNARHHIVSVLHAELSRKERQDVMCAFKRGLSRVLVTTDITARGIDVQHVSIVINFDLPTNAETYLHRIGRSGRYGRLGLAINFVRPRADQEMMAAIESTYKIAIREMPQNFMDYLGSAPSMDGDDAA